MRKLIFSLLLVGSIFSSTANNREKPLHCLIPDFAMTQFAGSMGLFSYGAGWTYDKYDRWATEFSMGIIPKGAYDDIIPTFTLKQSISTRKREIKNSSIEITPFTGGIFFSYICAPNYWIEEPDRYNPPYYRFPTKVRLNMFVGQQAYHALDRGIFKSVALYYELSVSDLHLVSAYTNSYLKPDDYLSLGFGIRAFFR